MYLFKQRTSLIHNLFCFFFLISACWPRVVLAQICNLKQFLDTCPTSDAAYATIKNDFVIRKDGALASEPTCQEPVSQMPIDQVSDELEIALSLRTLYYLQSSEQPPWTSKTLYQWLHEKVSGINIISTGPDSCCNKNADDGKTYFNLRSSANAGSEPNSSPKITKEGRRSPAGVVLGIGAFAHERRHADGIGHVGCCPAGAGACDQEYNESNLSAYGIQYWLAKRFVDGTFYTGYTCFAAADANAFKQIVRSDANGHVSRFCANAPPILTDANNPAPPCQQFCKPKVKQ